MPDQRSNPDFPTSIGLLLLRVGACGFMVLHGWGKVQMLIDGRSAEFVDPIGLGATTGLALTAFAEFLCAMLVGAGFITRIAAIPPALSMAVSAFVSQADRPLTSGEAVRQLVNGVSTAETYSSKEPALLFLAAFLALFFTGPGRFSVDFALRVRRAEKALQDARS